MSYYVIAVSADPVEGRCEKYFNGNTSSGFHGETTPFLKDAREYRSFIDAWRELDKLAPRLLGAWTVMKKETA